MAGRFETWADAMHQFAPVTGSASWPERDVGLVQNPAVVDHDGQLELGVLAVELHRGRRDSIASAGCLSGDLARPGSGHSQLPGQQPFV